MQRNKPKNGTMFVAIAILSVGAVSGCGTKNGKSGLVALPPEAVSVQTVQLSNQSIGETYLGTVTPFIQTTLAPAGSGQLSQLSVRAGQTVQAGQTLASLNPSTVVPEQNAANQAGAALLSAQQQYADAEAVFNDNLGATQQISSAQSGVNEQSAAVKTAEVNLQKAELQEQAILNGTATNPQDTAALQAVVTADQNQVKSAQKALQIAESNLNILKQSLDTAEQSYGNITEAEVQKASQAYQDALSHYQSWANGGFSGTNPYQTIVTEDNSIYQNDSNGYNALQTANQQYNTGLQTVAQDKSTISTAESNLADAQKEVADAAPPGSNSNTAQQAKASVATAQASLNQAKTQYNAALNSLKLAQQMAGDKTQAKSALDNAANALRQDQVSAQSAERSLQVQIQNGQVISPISGIVQSVGAQVGQEIGPSTDLVTIATTNPTMVTVNVPETDIGKVHQGSPMNVTFPSLNTTYQGTVLDVQPELSQSTNEYPVDIIISGSHSDLLPGLEAEAQLQNTAEQKEILVPADAVLSLQSGAEEVFTESGNTVHSQIVEVGAMSSTEYQITSGLSVGEKIVVQGQNLLSDGDKVKVISSDGVPAHNSVNLGELGGNATKKKK